MKKIRIYGISDDIIEVIGDIQAEGSPRHGSPGFVVLDTGDVFEVKLTSTPEHESLWKVSHKVVTGKVTSAIAPPIEEDEYSEVAFVTGDFERLNIVQSYPIDAEEAVDILEAEIEARIVRGRLSLDRDHAIAMIEAITREPFIGK